SRIADQRNDVIECVDRLVQSFQDMGTCLCLSKVKFGPATNDLSPEGDKGLQHPLKRQKLWLAVDDGDADNSERRLQWRQLIKLVQDHLRNRVTLELDDHTNSFAVRFVADL